MEQNKQPRRPFAFYLSIIITVVLLNAFVFPELFNRATEEVDYGTFLQMIDEGIVTEVKIKENNITYKTVEDETETIYETGVVEDPKLVERLHGANVEFKKIVPRDYSTLFMILFTWVLPLGLLILIGRMFVKRSAGGVSNAMTFGKSNARVYVEAETGKSFDDVAGQDEAKESLLEIVDFLHHPEKYREIGAKMPKGVLLVGPPGTGKTLLAEALAGESKVPFFSISGSEFVEMFVGTGAARVRDLFKQAEEKAPCIVFIDELDAIGKSRGIGGMQGGNEEREQTLNQLLSEMDGFDADQGILILAATNRPEILDKALLRPGRFDRHIPVELPDLEAREAILKVHVRKVKLAEDVNLLEVAKILPGASGADLANIVNEGALRAIKLGRERVHQEDLEESIEVVIAGYPRKHKVLQREDKFTVAYHEVGHAIVGHVQEDSAPIHKITIVPRTSGALGYTLQVEEGDQVLLSKEQAISKITTFMAGRAAEELVFERITSGAADDIEQATKIARAMVTRYGMSEEFGMMALETINTPYLSDDATLLVSPETATKVDRAVLKTIKLCYDQALSILKENEDKLHEIADYLFEKETISGEEFIEMFERK
ncbi:MAG TPA: ATP-dependent zinc metalloprotease FtsH [Pseudogracilibacillus sp.]|nr:ATP-dependent zinc metalloprotease FtsH [Pseudogracilibacillus sp.]